MAICNEKYASSVSVKGKDQEKKSHDWKRKPVCLTQDKRVLHSNSCKSVKFCSILNGTMTEHTVNVYIYSNTSVWIWGTCTSIFSALQTSTPHILDGNIVLFTQLHLFDSFSYFLFRFRIVIHILLLVLFYCAAFLLYILLLLLCVFFIFFIFLSLDFYFVLLQFFSLLWNITCNFISNLRVSLLT